MSELSKDKFLVTKALLLLVFLVLLANSLFAIQIKYKFKSGYKYIYKTVAKTKTRILAPELPEKQFSNTRQGSFTLNIVDTNKNIAIIDISTHNKIVRRYLKETGQIVSAPTESGTQIPFFVTFPSKDWAIGEKIQTKKTIKIANMSVPASVNMILKSFDKKNQTAKIFFKTSLALPQNKIRKKQFSMKGKMTFNIKKGCVESLIYKYNYKFAFANKEIAIKRHLWTYEEEIQLKITLNKIDKDTNK